MCVCVSVNIPYPWNILHSYCSIKVNDLNNLLVVILTCTFIMYSMLLDI